MTTGPAASRLQNDSLLGISAGIIAALAAGFVCKWAGLPDQATTAVTVSAGGVPAAVALRIKSLRRDPNVDIARIEHGELRRPVGLVVMLLAAAIILLDTMSGAAMGGIGDFLGDLITAHKIDPNTANVVGGPLQHAVPPIFLGMCLLLVASYASHYFAKRPYLWTATAVGCALAVRELLVFAFRSTRGIKLLIEESFGSLAGLLVSEVLGYLGVLFICMVGVWLGRRYHDAFLAKKLVRIEGKAARQQFTPQSQTTTTQASPPDSNAPQDSAPKLATFVSPGALPSAPDGHRISDPIKQIEKLAHLRDAGALTEEEFQAKKTEILCRI
jgi:hypothetical protein